MSEHDEGTAASRLEELENTLHLEQKHPNYEYSQLNLETPKDVFADVQFTLINGWEDNTVLNNLLGSKQMYHQEENLKVGDISSVKCVRFFKRKITEGA